MSIFAAGFNEYIPQRGLRGGFGKKAEEKQGQQIWYAGSDRYKGEQPTGREKLGQGTFNLIDQGELYQGDISCDRGFQGHYENLGSVGRKDAALLGPMAGKIGRDRKKETKAKQARKEKSLAKLTAKHERKNNR